MKGKAFRHAIITQPTKASAIDYDELDIDNTHWLDKSRSLQARRWRKIKHQTA